MEDKYSLVGVNGNAFAIMGYTSNALKNEGLGDYVADMQREAMSGDYENLIRVCSEYIGTCNACAENECF